VKGNSEERNRHACQQSCRNAPGGRALDVKPSLCSDIDETWDAEQDRDELIPLGQNQRAANQHADKHPKNNARASPAQRHTQASDPGRMAGVLVAERQSPNVDKAIPDRLVNLHD
jgi:hypothetical protein